LLSDGGPTILVGHEQTSIKNIAGISSCEDLSTAGFSDPSIQQKGVCGPDLVKALANNDQAPSITGTQTVNTYTVGFDLGAGASEAKDYLQKLATDGNGQFFDANGAGGVNNLVNIFQNIFNSITQKPLTIARLGTTIDVSTLSSSRDEVYVPTFSAAPGQPRWPGNLKGYTLDLLGFLKGLDNKPVFMANGDFNPSSRSYWSASADGGSVASGGVASLLNPSVRNLKTDEGPGASRSLQSLDSANSTLTGNPSLFGLPVTTILADVQEHVDWIRGIDVDDENTNGNTTESRNSIGDALHTEPVVANYDGSKTDPIAGGSIDRVVFFMTNEGYLHAINVTGNTSSDSGTELFAYMPSDLLPNTDILRTDVGGDPKVYGLDGPMTLFQVGGITNVAGSKYLFFGMRRGGMNYYAMDVTDPLAPSLMWVIEGGSGDFQEMGQSWSKPIVTNVNVGGTKT
jgi:type IV pilus assembly protein PilY1